MLAAEVFARFIGDSSSLVRAANSSAKAIGGVSASADRVSRATASSMNRMATDVKSVGLSFKNVLGNVVKFGAAIGVFQLVMGAVQGVKSAFLDYNSLLEQTSIGFTTMLGSADAAAAMMKRLQDFAARTPFTFKGLVQSAQQLLVMGYNAQELIPTLRTIGDAVAAMGGSMEYQGERVIRAFTQMRAKGKVSAEEMMQLAEAGIPAWEYLADAIGTDIPTAMDKAKKSGISASIAIDGILKGMSRDFGGMMEAQSKTLQGAWSTVLDYLQIQVANATRPIYNKFSQMIQSAAQALSGPGAAAFGENLTKMLERGFETAESIIVPLVEHIADAIGELVPMTSKLIGNLGPVWRAFGAAIVIAVNALQLFADIIGTTARFIEENELAMKGLTAAVTALIAVLVANKVMGFFKAFQMGATGMINTVKGLGAAKAAYTAVDTSMIQATASSQAFANANAGMLGKINATAGAAGKAGFSFKTAGKNLLGAFGGPAGLAVTAGIAGIGFGLNKLAEDAAKAKARVEDFKGALEGITDFGKQLPNVTNRVEDLVKANDDVAEKLKDAGISTRDFTDAIVGGKSATQEFIDRLYDKRHALVVSGDAHREEIKAIEAVIQAMEGEGGAFLKAKDAIQDQVQAQRRQAQEAATAAALNKTLGESVGNIGKSFDTAARETGEAAKAVAEAVDKIAGSLKEAADPFSEFATDSMISLDDWEKNLDEKLQYIGNWGKNMQTALAAGLSPTAMQYLIDQGPAAMGEALAQLAKEPERIAGFNDRVKNYMNLENVAAYTEQQMSLIQAIVEQGMTLDQLRAEFGPAIEREIAKLPPNIQAALAKNEGRMGAAFTDALAKAMDTASAFAKASPLELDAKVNGDEAMREFESFLAGTTVPEMIVGADPADAMATITEFLVTVGATPANIPIEGTDDKARAAAQDFLDYVESQVGTIDFAGDPEGATQTLMEFLGMVNDSEGTSNIKARDEIARLVLYGFTGDVDASSGTSTIFGDDSPGRITLGKLVDSVNRSSGTISEKGNAGPAYGALASAVAAINRSHGTIGISGNGQGAIDAAAAAVAAIQRMRATIFIDYQIRNPGAITPGPQVQAEGGIFAASGMIIDFSRRNEKHDAQLAPPGAWRIWAEPETGGEAYIPLAGGKRPRSLNILAEVADIFGYVLVKQMKAGGFMRGGGVIDTSKSPIMPTRRGTINVNTQFHMEVKAGDILDAGGFQHKMNRSIKTALAEHDRKLIRELGVRK